MNPQFIEILLLLSKAVPVIAVLWLWLRSVNKERTSNIIKLDEQQKYYEAKIDALQDELRANEKETLGYLNQFTKVLDKVVESTGEGSKEIQDMLKSISRKLDKINKEI